MKALFLGFVIVFSSLAASAQQVSGTDKVITSYIALKNALVGSNAALAKTRSKELLNTLSVKPADLKPAQQLLYSKYADKLKLDSRHISESSVLARQREHFSSLSKNMYALLSALKTNSSPLYQQYCPMKKASWLSETEEIRNPYYGDEMLECGTVKATLNPASK
ncbi:DUF3347 domain-containing protein [Mucilaginibacter terrenus]|uniref:DUF3347 domain-containing protein n=1 Tax=Mucilaginibacter terrenus TaxID=2482727 RepID=A0A3E2NPW6_9SPHI|nr:DUF3347 domain-containing protein [Mucilaginibacter terrenus]RFZ83028.1 DUF3347 domain-containing protein [Mucilaginibacter terrenus]